MYALLSASRSSLNTPKRIGSPFRNNGINVSSISRKLRHAFAMSLYWRLSRSLLGAELVLCADKNDMMFAAGMPIMGNPSAGFKYSFWCGSSCVLLSPAYRSNMMSFSPHSTTSRLIMSVCRLIFTFDGFITFPFCLPCLASPCPAVPCPAMPRHAVWYLLYLVGLPRKTAP